MGEGEKLVRALFAVARELQPSVIFIGLYYSIYGMNVPQTFIPQTSSFCFYFTFRWSRQLALWKEGGRTRRLSSIKNWVPHWIWRGKSSSSSCHSVASEIGSWTSFRLFRSLLSQRALVLVSQQCLFVSGAVRRGRQGACNGSDQQTPGARWSSTKVHDETLYAKRLSLFLFLYRHTTVFNFSFVLQTLCKKNLRGVAGCRGIYCGTVITVH